VSGERDEGVGRERVYVRARERTVIKLHVILNMHTSSNLCWRFLILYNKFKEDKICCFKKIIII